MLWVGLVLGAAVIVALLRGGKLSNFTDIRLSLWWLLLLGAAIQAATTVLPDDRSWSTGLAVSLILVSFLLLMIVIAANHSEVGMWIAGIGVLMNFVVIALNGGMPVMAEAARIAGAESADLAFDAKHVLLDSDSRLVFLADVIPLPFMRQVVSIGDVLFAVGLGLFLEDQLRKPVRWFKHAGTGSRPGSASRGQ